MVSRMIGMEVKQYELTHLTQENITMDFLMKSRILDKSIETIACGSKPTVRCKTHPQRWERWHSPCVR